MVGVGDVGHSIEEAHILLGQAKDLGMPDHHKGEQRKQAMEWLQHFILKIPEYLTYSNYFFDAIQSLEGSTRSPCVCKQFKTYSFRK